MSTDRTSSNDRRRGVSRRNFVKTTAALAAVPLAGETLLNRAWAGGTNQIRVGLIGCGGRGTGAAVNALEAAEYTRIVALADVFSDRLNGCRNHLKSRGERGTVADDHCFTGFDAYRQLLALREVDLVILATPPHFRPIHFEAAVDAGKHVFMEKPVAVDGSGIRAVLAAGQKAYEQGLAVVAGTQRRHEPCYLAAIEQLKQGAIGDVVAARCYWNQGGLWMNEPRSEWTDMEWQLRNWLYFTWLSGDHIVEQHVHNLDVVNWAFGAHPLRAMGMGGREVRTHANYGNIFDHFALEYEYPGDRWMMSMCRQIDGCAGRVEERFSGTKGLLRTHPGHAAIQGENAWRFRGENRNPYVQEHVNLLTSIESGQPLNEAKNVAEATLTAIMGRMSAYTGKEVTWEQALNSELELVPPAYEFGPLDVRPVSVPGKTPLV